MASWRCNHRARTAPWPTQRPIWTKQPALSTAILFVRWHNVLPSSNAGLLASSSFGLLCYGFRAQLHIERRYEKISYQTPKIKSSPLNSSRFPRHIGRDETNKACKPRRIISVSHPQSHSHSNATPESDKNLPTTLAFHKSAYTSYLPSMSRAQFVNAASAQEPHAASPRVVSRFPLLVLDTPRILYVYECTQ
ncbi:hypothetical protein TGAM01_v200161 [Trichoderma gamsii]|uniref:Uncharacterized protein n=1 Tax=Trichoderma gamsii TaxID=398673 RepID=A0A2P5A2I3_9HYPO|nr:hypothetical protein TGAM01_v200161 [Trichoderma gamsii]PON30741.1 hypothetical protein TGAM01_v200161 [Trichoderma gamsii]